MLPLPSCCHRLLSTATSHVRVRYAPSPTGSLHLGGLRTALFNYLFARHHGGVYLVRVEDTDQARLVPGSVESLLHALRVCGLEHDEGPGRDSPVGPFIQSQRLPLYTEHAAQLVEGGHAYRCFCSPARLEALRERQVARGLPTVYDRVCLGVPREESAARARGGEAHVVRLAVPPGGTTHIQDAVVGGVTFPHTAVDDQVLVKTSGWPTYHLANVVDDHLMGITHVIRGQEWLPSTPKHTLLYAALGWSPPVFAHLPLLLSPDKSKLSKRKGDAAVEDFLASGFLPSALVNFVALLGWSPPSTSASSTLSPTASLEELAALFTLSGVHKANAVVERSKLEWTNAQHIKGRVMGWRQQGAGVTTSSSAATAAIAAAATVHTPSDTEGMRGLREAITEPLIASLGTFIGGGEEEGRRRVATPAHLPPHRFNALIAAQHERVGSLHDIIPLLLPFVLSVERDGEGVFLAYLASTGPLEALGRVGSGGGGGSKGGVAPPPPLPLPSPVTALPPPSILTVLSPFAALLERVAGEWERMSPSPYPNPNNPNPLLPGAAAGEVERHSTSDAWAVEAVKVLKAAAKASSTPPGKAMLAVRWCVTGLDAGTAFTDTLGLVGGKECLGRLRAVVGTLKAAAAAAAAAGPSNGQA